MPIISISRGAKSGGIALAEKLAERLGYRCLSREIVVESAKKYNIVEETLQEELSQPPSFFKRITREKSRYLIFVRCSLLQAALEDNIVYHGHAGQLFLEGIDHVLRVRLEAPLEYRVERAMKEMHLDQDEAIAHIKKVDLSRERWVRFLHDRKWTDPTLYDLTVHLTRMSLDTACEIVAHAAMQPEFQPTDASRAALRDAWLACEVKAAIAADDELWSQQLEVSARDGVVVIEGGVADARLKKVLDDLVPMVKGVTDVHLRVRQTNARLSGAPFKD